MNIHCIHSYVNIHKYNANTCFNDSYCTATVCTDPTRPRQMYRVREAEVPVHTHTHTHAYTSTHKEIMSESQHHTEMI